MTITSMTPAPTRLAGNLEAVQDAAALAIASLEDAGEGARAFGRIAFAVESQESVDRLAARWGVNPYWSREGVMYIARKPIGGHDAELEAVFYAPSKTAGNEAAA